MQLDPADVALCVADDGLPGPDGAVPASTPIVQTSLFAYPAFRDLAAALRDERRHHVYTRGQNPTVEALERKLAALERGEACKAFASGMAAISAVLFGTLGQGDHVLFVNHTYGPTLELAEQLRRMGIEHDLLVDPAIDGVRAAVRPGTRLIWLESPGTMLFQVADLAAIAEFAQSRHITTCIDNSWATPLLQKPIECGIDLVVHTGTKYLGGHSDVMGGAVIGTSARIEELFYRAYLLLGGLLAPIEAWLLLRGLRTLPVRLARCEADGLQVAEFLRGHPAVAQVFHPAFVEAPPHVARQLRGFSGTFSFALRRGEFDAVCAVIDALRQFRIAVSWGGVESLVISPNRGDNLAQLDAQQIPRGLIRLSVGLEGADTLVDDLERALRVVA